MQIQASVAALSLALVAFTAEASVPVTVYNQCSENVDLYDNSAVETIAPGGTTSRTLAEGFSGMFRNGVSSQATLAEFAVTGGFLWYDISIIPTGTVGPGYCGSLEECKAVTGGTGYNTPMQIAPSGCQTVTCLQDGCADAYQYPKDDTKTHACSDTTSVVLTFCPGGSGGSTPSTYDSTQQQQQQQQQQEMTPAPTTTAPPTQPPTQAPTTQPPTEAPTTQPPTQPPTEAPTTQPPTEAPTQPPTEAPTQPPTEAPTQPPTEAPTQAPTEAPTPTPTETPTATTVTPELTTETPSTPEVQYASSNSTSNDEEQEAATVAPSKVTKTGTTTAATPAPVAQVISAPSTSTSSKSSNDNTETANTQASADNGTDSGTFIATGLGGCAVIAAVAVVAVARKKKKELDATEGKDYSQEELMTPVTQINVL
ncbi:hypothetical protein, variant 1 [Phytophthora nicotianae CJ01A1]|uniref:Uncharacterized protein n=3 Tax=Phytophthora nicotianae TaxID=4792 RepID=W2VZB5_PHYNI|nr:hypothetical protein F441_19429 [Phytophthora nicotianae CJ01A1]ETP03628.1 hypothetical protein, variant 1 [Phytophthora nicotianae CJ01A1]